MDYLPTVSVIVPVYNSQNTLKDCVDSLLKLDYPADKLEIILVDNNSNGKTKDILNFYGDKVKVLSETKRGAAAARNKGVMNSSGDIVAFTDSDCAVDPKWLSKLIEPLSDTGVGIAGGKILAKKPCNNIEQFGEIIHNHKNAITKIGLPYAITMNWASRISVLKETGLFNEDLIRCQDTDLSRRIYYKGYRLIYVDDAVIYHSNRRSLSSLFYQGYIHGFWGIKLNKLHRKNLKRYNYDRFNFKSYKYIMLDFTEYLSDRSRLNSLYFSVFNTGKKIGKIVGSVRFGYPEV